MAEKRAIVGIINYLWIRKKIERMNIFEENQFSRIFINERLSQDY